MLIHRTTTLPEHGLHDWGRYPLRVRRGQVERSGADLRPVPGIGPVSTQVFRYLIKFEELAK